MSKYTLGLDLGPTSVGWAAVEVNEDGNFTGLAKIPNKDPENPESQGWLSGIDSRIFPAGVENYGQGQKEQTRNKKCRESRSNRRNLRRRRARRLQLISLLRKHTIIPDDDNNLQSLQSKDPYEIRSNALKGKLDLYEIGRIILHMAKRRGFKSNRKDFAKEIKETDFQQALKTANEIKETLGQHWYVKRNKNDRVAIRNRKGHYRLMPERKQYQTELSLIWKKQQEFYPDILTDSLLSEISSILFKQIDYEISNRKKRKVIGRCSLIPRNLRCSFANRRAQEFRLLQKINDLEVRRKGKKIDISEKRQKLVDELMICKEVPFTKIRKILGLENKDRINFEYEGNKGLIGNEIDHQIIRKLIDKKEWKKLDETKKNETWQLIMSFFNDEDVTIETTAKDIERLSGTRIKDADNIREIKIPTKTVKFSTEALDRLLPFLRDGAQLYDAIEKAGFSRKYRTLNKLPLPDPAHGFHITNPNVRVVLFELRKVVNRLISELGKPDKIVIEFYRELKASKEVRKQILGQQTKRRSEREKSAKEICDEYTSTWKVPDNVPGWAIEKYILWKDQGRECPYTGEPIPQHKLFSRETEIDHILPYSMSLDNTMNNKVVCFTKENQDKGQRTPLDWIGGDEKRWEKLQQAIDRWNPKRKGRGKVPVESVKGKTNKDKWERFFVGAEEIEELYWNERYKRETGYIAREVRDYLKRLYHWREADQRVVTTKGSVTGQLRRWWDLNRILGADDDKKERADLRHHALDAAVIGVTCPKNIRRVTQELRRAYPKNRPRDVYVPRPWEGFEEELKNSLNSIVVSHRVQRKVKGKLHKETHYWKETNGVHTGKYITRKWLDTDFKVAQAERICDDKIKKLVKKRLSECNNDPKRAFVKPLYLTKDVQIRRVRIWEKHKDRNMLKIRGNVYVERPENHHIEIFQREDGAYVCKTWDMWEVASRVKRKEPIVLKRHPKYPDAEFVMSLAKGETVELDGKKGRRVFARVIQVGSDENEGKQADLHLWEVNVARLDERIKKETPGAYRIRSMKEFKELGIKKVTVDPLGRIRRAND